MTNGICIEKRGVNKGMCAHTNTVKFFPVFIAVKPLDTEDREKKGYGDTVNVSGLF